MSTPINSSIRQFVSGSLDHIQDKVASADSIESLIKELVSQLPFRDQLSIVYQGYGQQQAQVVISANQTLSDEEGKTHHLAQHKWVQAAIHQTGLGKGVLQPETDEIAADKDFCKYQDVAIVPMRLNGHKNIGAFVLHSNSQYFDKEDINSLDKLSDRMAFFIQNNLRRRRNRTFSRFTNDALSKRYASEAELLQDILLYLNEWFTEDTIYLLIRDPLDKHQYFLVNEGLTITEDHRAPQKKLNPSQLAQIAFDETMLRKDLKSSKGILLHRTENDQFSNEYTSRSNRDNEKVPLNKDACSLGSHCHSWLGATMHLNDKRSLGHIILHNSAAKAYQFEDDDFLDSMADFAALLLGRFREQEKYKMIDALNDFRFGSTVGHAPNDLYTLAFEQLRTLYGVGALQISLFDRKSMLLQPVFEQGGFPDISDEKKREYSQFVLEKGASNRQRVNEHMSELIITLMDNKKYLLVPMRINRQAKIQHPDQVIEEVTHRAIGCFIVPATNVGDFTASTIDDLSDVLAGQINLYNDNERRKKITKQSHEVANLEINNLTQKTILELAHNFVAESMFSENFYFALYDKAEGKISFPVIFKNNEPWVVNDRAIDLGALGKTEAIIYSRQAIHHHTREESEAWYSLENHEEHGGDPLASWIGVPVFLDGEVIGVIATYHPTLDWVYTQQDKFFLESVATQVSGLFRAFRLSESKDNNKKLEEANRKLEEAIDNNTALNNAIRRYEMENKRYKDLLKLQGTLAELERKETFSSISQDIVHNLNNRFGPISILLGSSKIQFKKLKENPYDEKASHKLEEKLEQAYETSLDVLKNTKRVTSFKKENVNINKLLENITNQIETHFNYLHHSIFLFEFKENIELHAHESTFENMLYSIIFNAAEAISRKRDNQEEDNGTYIKIITTSNQTDFIIDISDNGSPCPIPVEIEEKIFDYKITDSSYLRGYGLPRSKAYFLSQGGNLELNKNTEEEKTFRIYLPKPSKELIFFVLDDDQSWIDIIQEWIEENYDAKTYTSNNYNDAIKQIDNIMKNHETINVALLDISLNDHARNNSGLLITQKIQSIFTTNKTKICILTNFPEMAKNYKNSVDKILPKVNSNSIPISENEFTNAINEIIHIKE